MKGGLDRREPTCRLTWTWTYREVIYQKKKGTEWAGRVAPVVGHMCFLLRVKLHLLIDAKYFSKLLSRS
jgi:hypothetical protein